MIMNHLKQLAAIGLQGIEVAPSRVWLDTWKRFLSVADVEAYPGGNPETRTGLGSYRFTLTYFDHPNQTI